MNRTEMIKWLSENTTREQWVNGFELPKFKTTLHEMTWKVYDSCVNVEPYYYVTHMFPKLNSPIITVDDVFEPVNEQPVTREEMIKWLSENTTREQWFSDVNPLFFKGVNEYPEYWGTYPVLFSNEYFVFNNETREKITVDDVFEPVNEQPAYIDGGIYEIGVMNGEPQQFVYNLKLNMFERGSNESIGASNVHDSKVVTHFKLLQGPSSERATVAKEIINNIRRGANNEFTNSSAVTSEPQGLLNHRREPSSAVKILNDAAECIGDRAAERDTDNERSMLSTVNAFNAMYGTELTETQGWMFMVFLKASRAKGGDFREDDYTDGSSYFALAGECDGNVRR